MGTLIVTLVLITVALGVGMLLGARLSSQRAGQRECPNCEEATTGRHNLSGRGVDPIIRTLLAEQRSYAP